jgi:hypothetical protein
MIKDISGESFIGNLNVKNGLIENLPADDIAIVPDLIRGEYGEWKIQNWRLVQRTQVETRPMSGTQQRG